MTNEEQRRNALRSLNEAERAAVLDALLREHPELQDRADRLAAERLELVDRDVVAETVSMALESISPEEVGNRSGRQRGLGYVEPTQAVWDLLEETVQPYLQDIVRRAGLGMTDATLDLGLGVIAGLYECRRARDDGSVLAWAPAEEAMPELAAEVMSRLAAAGVTVPAEVLDELCPEWDLA